MHYQEKYLLNTYVGVGGMDKTPLRRGLKIVTIYIKNKAARFYLFL